MKQVKIGKHKRNTETLCLFKNTIQKQCTAFLNHCFKQGIYNEPNIFSKLVWEKEKWYLTFLLFFVASKLRTFFSSFHFFFFFDQFFRNHKSTMIYWSCMEMFLRKWRNFGLQPINTRWHSKFFQEVCLFPFFLCFYFFPFLLYSKLCSISFFSSFFCTHFSFFSYFFSFLFFFFLLIFDIFSFGFFFPVFLFCIDVFRHFSIIKINWYLTKTKVQKK